MTPRHRARGAALATLALITIPATAIGVWRSSTFHDIWGADPYIRAVFVAEFVTATAGALGAAFLVVRRPSNRCGIVAVLLMVVFTAWWVANLYRNGTDYWRELVPLVLVYSFRPLLFFLVLAFPTGRLDRAGRRLFAVLVTTAVLTFAITVFTAGRDGSLDAPVTLWHESAWTLLTNSAWWDVGALVIAVAVLVVVRRRALRYSGPGARIAAPAFWAALVATSGDFLLISSGPLRDLYYHANRLTPWGAGVQIVDFMRWGGTVAVLAAGAVRAWPREQDRRTVELDAAEVASLRADLGRALGDPTVEITVYDAARGWQDLAGAPRPEPGSNRAATVVTEAGEPIAALEYDEATAAHPAVIDAAVAAVALELESTRQIALARAREIELRHLVREVIAAEDDARRRLERDLHDGIQQVLVGTTLQAALAVRSAKDPAQQTAAAVALAAGIEDARRALVESATGRPPSLIAERGLHGALGALVLTAGLPVHLDVASCDDLPDALQRAIWFTAAEAVTNALKHAAARTLRVDLRRNGAIALSVADDGCGGVLVPPAALAWRVADAGGTLTVDSTLDGTTVTAVFPVAPSSTTEVAR